jgi:hypothetical protein
MFSLHTGRTFFYLDCSKDPNLVPSDLQCCGSKYALILVGWMRIWIEEDKMTKKKEKKKIRRN